MIGAEPTSTQTGVSTTGATKQGADCTFGNLHSGPCFVLQTLDRFEAAFKAINQLLAARPSKGIGAAISVAAELG